MPLHPNLDLGSSPRLSVSARDSEPILVVGAGPAGSVAARGLALAGRKVRLVDKAKFPRRKVCGCCLNGNALAALESVGLGSLPARLGAVPLTEFTTATAGRTATVPLKGVSLSRDAFDLALIEEAMKAGVEFRDGTTIHDPPEGFDTIIYASGLNGIPSKVSRHSRLGGGTILNEFPAFYQPGRIFMAVGKGGYVGLVRLEDGRLDVAAAFDPAFVRSSGGLAAAAERVLEEAGFPPLRWSPGFSPSSSGIEDGLKPELQRRVVTADWKGTPALTRTPTRIAGPGWFAVGDAAGYVEPFTGEGMAWAIAGAAALVPFVLNNDPAGWTRAHRKLIGRRQRTCRGLARLLRAPGVYEWVVRGLNLVPAVARPVVTLLNRATTV